MSTCWFNGELIDEGSAHVSIRDLGLLHGVGVFTTMRAEDRRVYSLDAHLARIRASCEAFAIPLTYNDADLETALADLLATCAFADARLRLTVTRGTIKPFAEQGIVIEPSVFITAIPLDSYPKELYTNGMTVLAYETFKLNPYDPQAGHKTLDYLSRFSALREAQQRGANEALLFNVHNFLQSGAISNVFLVKSGKLLTPPTQADLIDDSIAKKAPYPRSNVLPGIVRATILAEARDASIECEIRALTINDLLEADEVFMTNSLMNVMPVCRIERKEVGSGKPGPITRQLSQSFLAGGKQ